MSLRLPQTPRQVLRIVAALTTVIIVILLGSVGTSERSRPTYHHYVALGDSFTAAPFVPLTDVAYGCYRSSNNYPNRLASLLHIEDLKDRSCSGARTAELVGSQTTRGGMSVPPQLDALSERTDLVTVGIGVNNHHLYARMATVCRRSPGSAGSTTSASARLERRPGPARARPGPRSDQGAGAERAGAPRGLPEDAAVRGGCPRLPRMRGLDRGTFRDISLRLRYGMRDAAREAGVEFVDFYAVSAGHDICSRHPWVQGRRNRKGAGLHPLAAGQAALARTIEQTLRVEPRRTG